MGIEGGRGGGVVRVISGEYQWLINGELESGLKKVEELFKHSFKFV